MMPALTAEWRKLWSVRSTYVVLAILLAFIILGGFYIEGFTTYGAVLDNYKLANAALNATPTIAQLVVISAVLLMAHEYRYNLINYSLTFINRRAKVMAAKVAVVALFTVLVTLVGVFLTMVLAYLGMHLKGTAIPHQDLMLGAILWRSIAYTLGFTLLGLSLITLTRSILATLIMLYLGIHILEVPLSFILKHNAVYLPLQALELLTQPFTTAHVSVLGRRAEVPLGSPLKGLGVFSVYLVVTLAVSWYLFIRRDAS